MKKTLLITGATDGIGLASASQRLNYRLPKVITCCCTGAVRRSIEDAKEAVAAIPGAGETETFVADFSRLAEVESMAKSISERHDQLDVLINNAGVYKTPNRTAENGLDVRFVVNTIAPYLLTRRLLELIPDTGRVVNLSSAAQDSVDLAALLGERQIGNMPAYAQSKLAITMWTRSFAQELGAKGPVIVAVNPGSLLASKMVKEGFGMECNDLGIGAEILQRAVLSDEFTDASGKYFDNDARRFSNPHPDALDDGKCAEVVHAIESILPK